jgi:hypothetical protein
MAAASKARAYQTQQCHFYQTTLNYNDADALTRLLGILPAGATLLAVKNAVLTAFNAGTTNTMSIGTTAGGTDILNAAAAGVATGIVNTLPPVAKVVFATDQSIYVSYAQTGTAATAGQAKFVMEYAPNI